MDIRRIRRFLGFAFAMLLIASCSQPNGEGIDPLAWEYGLAIVVEGLPTGASSELVVAADTGATSTALSTQRSVQLGDAGEYRIDASAVEYQGTTYLPSPNVQLVRVEGPDTPVAVRYLLESEAAELAVDVSVQDARVSVTNDETGTTFAMRGDVVWTLPGGTFSVMATYTDGTVIRDEVQLTGGNRAAVALLSCTDTCPPAPETEEPAQSPSPSYLHVSPEELAIWRDRAVNGPYRSRGDASANSPGDWQRIRDHADRFLADPTAAIWEGHLGDGCVPRETYDRPPVYEMIWLRDAAFVHLVTGESKYRDAALDTVLHQTRIPRLDFSDESIWCRGTDLSDASFFISNWMTAMLFTYDYLGEESFTSEENESIRRWFLDAAEFFQYEADNDLETLFVDRYNGRYELTSKASARCGRVTHYDGHETCALHRLYNNRRASQVRFVALAGIRFGVDSMKQSGKMFVKEFIRFSVFPDGLMGEYERWRSGLPDLGWGYASAMLGTMVTIADHFARTGDTELYEFQTSEGALGTQGGEKSLRLPIETLQALAMREMRIYGTDQASQTTEEYRIDGVHEPADWYGLHDLMTMPSNQYYQDESLRSVYLREESSYYEQPAGVGATAVWMGEWGMYPGLFFMFEGADVDGSLIMASGRR